MTHKAHGREYFATNQVRDDGAQQAPGRECPRPAEAERPGHQPTHDGRNGQADNEQHPGDDEHPGESVGLGQQIVNRFEPDQRDGSPAHDVQGRCQGEPHKGAPDYPRHSVKIYGHEYDQGVKTTAGYARVQSAKSKPGATTQVTRVGSAPSGAAVCHTPPGTTA
ncbi:hypothetical protein GCM10009682_32840 [Luedemannella flava]|uniref:Uncharacterized protein n=1 Tax=Luedemannella flava TaxID=349316 RepID=A0ABN2M460_9ACTN